MNHKIIITCLILSNLLTLVPSCTPFQLSQKLNEERIAEIKTEFNVISQSTKDYVDSIVQIKGLDSTVKYFSNDAWYFYKVGDFGRSVNRFNRILYLNEFDPNPYWGYGLILSSKCELDSSIELLKKAIKHDSSNIRLRCDLAYTKAVKLSSMKFDQESKENYKEIIEEYERLIPEFNTYPILACQYAEILAEVGDTLKSQGQLQIAKKQKYDIKNALKIIRHIKMGGTLYSFICQNNQKSAR